MTLIPSCVMGAVSKYIHKEKKLKKFLVLGFCVLLLTFMIAACMDSYGDNYSSSGYDSGPTYNAQYYSHQTVSDYSTGHVYDWTDSHGHYHRVSSCGCSSSSYRRTTTTIRKTRTTIRTHR
jgi:hypothetical protein